MAIAICTNLFSDPWAHSHAGNIWNPSSFPLECYSWSVLIISFTLKYNLFYLHSLCCCFFFIDETNRVFLLFFYKKTAHFCVPHNCASIKLCEAWFCLWGNHLHSQTPSLRYFPLPYCLEWNVNTPALHGSAFHWVSFPYFEFPSKSHSMIYSKRKIREQSVSSVIENLTH